MGQVVRLPAGMVALQEAVDAFLEHHDLAPSTRRVYRASLAGLATAVGPATTLSDLSGPRLAAWFRHRHAGAAPATWNRELATLRAAVGWWRRRGWLAGDPTEGLERRRDRPDRTRSLTRGQLEAVFARRELSLRERTLWRLLYETAARANELLCLNVEDLDLANRRARVRSKGGATEWVFWQAGSAQLLPRLLVGRTRGPVFLTGRRSAGAVAGVDLDPASGRARLSYRRLPSCFARAPGGRCTSCAIRRSPTPPRTAPTCRCWPAPGTPRSAPWSATPARDPRRSPATWPRPTRPAADHNPRRVLTSSALATPWWCGGSTGWAGRCAAWSTPSPGLPSAASGAATCRRRSTPSPPAGKPPAATQALLPLSLSTTTDGPSVRSNRDEGGLHVPKYLLINGTEPRWRLHDTIHSADLEKSLARVMENGAITYTLASRNEGETFQSLTIDGKTLVRSYGRNLWMSLWHESAAYLPP